jgi:HK97 family phage portal protein
MVLFDPRTWFRREEQKASAVGGAIAAFNVGQPVWSGRDYGSFAREGYIVNAIANRCTRLVAGNAAAIPWLLYQGDDEVDEHPLLALLARPSPVHSGAGLFEALYSYLLLAGNAYLERVGPTTGAPLELWSLRPDRMKVVAGPRGMPTAYTYEVNGRITRWDVEPRTGRCDVLHVKEFHPDDDWYGLGRMEAAAYGVDRHNAASAHNKALLDNGARPSGALVFQPVSGGKDAPAVAAPMEVIQKAEERLLERHGGPKNSGKPLVLGGNVKWEDMGITPKDMDFAISKDDAARDICLAFGVPHVLVVSGEATYNNRSTAQLELWEDAVLPLVDKMLDALNGWLAPMFGEGLRLAVDLDEIPALEPRRETKRRVVGEMKDRGIITRDEAREALQYEPWPNEIVGAVDAGVLAALIDGVDTLGFEPLARYMKSVGLYEPGMSIDRIIAAATAHLEREREGAEADELAAMTPSPPADTLNGGVGASA